MVELDAIVKSNATHAQRSLAGKNRKQLELERDALAQEWKGEPWAYGEKALHAELYRAFELEYDDATDAVERALVRLKQVGRPSSLRHTSTSQAADIFTAYVQATTRETLLRELATGYASGPQTLRCLLFWCVAMRNKINEITRDFLSGGTSDVMGQAIRHVQAATANDSWRWGNLSTVVWTVQNAVDEDRVVYDIPLPSGYWMAEGLAGVRVDLTQCPTLKEAWDYFAERTTSADVKWIPTEVRNA